MNKDINIGDCQLMFGDCLERMKEIPNSCLDMILCDLPYNTTKMKWDNMIPLEPLWTQYKRVIKSNGAIVLFGREPFSSKVRLSNEEMYKYDWIWEKSKATNFLFAKQMPLIAHEDIMVFYNRLPNYNPQKTKGKPYNKGIEKRTKIEAVGKIGNGNLIINESGDRNPRSVIYFRTAESEGKFHPTQKPVALLEYLIKTYTNEGELILDNCMGSGSTCVAAINTNRRFIGIEKDDNYFEIAQKRINEALKEKQQNLF
jgi:site-specific DNA-methyltransferase (adenine-specific)